MLDCPINFFKKRTDNYLTTTTATYQDGLMQPISSSIHPFSSSADPQLTAGTFRSSDLTLLNASSDTHTDLSVVTAGGDRVTLSAESLLRASYAEVNYQSTDQYHLDFHATDSQVQFGNSIDVSVQGQLDQQEQADVQLLVGKLEKVVKQFLGGDSAGALSKALQIGDLGTVASFELHVQQSAQIAFTQEQQISTDGAQVLPPQNAGTQDQAKPPSLVNQIVDTIHDSKIDTKKLLQYIAHLLKHVFNKLHATLSDQDVAQLTSDVETALKSNPVAPDPASS
jgi:hypothetical protein